MTVLPIVDLHTCIQGEGKYAGVPHILIRFTGCLLRCRWCDTPYSSIVPEKGKYTIESIEKFLKENQHIQHVMITGGSPTLYPIYLNRVVDLCKKEKRFVTLEVEGTRYVKTNADFISLSPKFESSAPDKTLRSDDWSHHMKHLYNFDAMKKLIENHPDYQIKPVITCEEDFVEVYTLKEALKAPSSKFYLMPQGVTAEQIINNSPRVIEFCIEHGMNFTSRIHVLVYGNRRDV